MAHLQYVSLTFSNIITSRSFSPDRGRLFKQNVWCFTSGRAPWWGRDMNSIGLFSVCVYVYIYTYTSIYIYRESEGSKRNPSPKTNRMTSQSVPEGPGGGPRGAEPPGRPWGHCQGPSAAEGPRECSWGAREGPMGFVIWVFENGRNR